MFLSNPRQFTKELTHHSNNNCPMIIFPFPNICTKALLTINAICILLVQIHEKFKKNMFLINHILPNVQHNIFCTLLTTATSVH